MDVVVDAFEGVAEVRGCGRSVSGQQWSQELVVHLGVEDRDALAVVGEDVGVGTVEAFDQPVEAQPRQVVAHLVGGVGGAEQSGDAGAKAPVRDAGDGVDPDGESADQGHDPRVAEPQGWGPPAVGGDRWQRDPLKGWARKDTALTDTLSMQQPVVGVTGLADQFGQMFQAALHSEVVRRVDDRLDPQCLAVFEVFLNPELLTRRGAEGSNPL